MSSLSAVREVARWELFRYVKLKQQVVGFIMTFAILLGMSFFNRLGSEPQSLEIAVIGAEHLPTLTERSARFEFRPEAPDREPELRGAVEARDLDGLLVLQAGGAGELFTRQDRAWRGQLERDLTMAVTLHRLQEAGLEPEMIAALQAPFRLEVEEAAPRAGATERMAALVALGLMLVGLFGGIGYIFSSVTGEKQNRLSEQVVSAIPAQSWIDGKIIGLASVSLVIVGNTVLAVAAWFAARWAIWGDAIPVPAVQRPGLLVIAIGFILLGYLFWFAFLTAVAALVDDPHNSNRSQLLFLPMLAAAPAFLAITDPTAVWVRILSLVPPTSSAVMPARILVTDVAAWEVAAAALLLLALTHVVRRIAGKVFRLGMLMYGKEPSWAEVRRWVREA
jgi:ABC-2 type transport system permease protein